MLGVQDSRRPLLLSVEAIIGAGKSTLLEALNARSDVVVVREPVDLWTKQRGGETLLSRYYADQKSNAFMFETYAMMSRVKALQDAMSLVKPETRAIVMERSWLSSRYCFGENSKELGHLGELESSLYEDLFDWGVGTWPKLDGVIFIDVSVSVAQDRVAVRGRTAESAIPSDYQAALVSKHRQWLLGGGSATFDGAVLTLDGNRDKNCGAIDDMVARVTEFVSQMCAEKASKVATSLRESILQDKENCRTDNVDSDKLRPISAVYHTPEKTGAKRSAPWKLECLEKVSMDLS